LAPPNFGLPEGEKTMGDYMKARGYTTAMIGKWHLGTRPACYPLKRGFDEFFGFPTGAHPYKDMLPGTDNPIYRGTEEVEKDIYLTDAFGREAVSFIDRHRNKPFLLYLAFNAGHHPLEAPARYENSFKEIKSPRRRTYAGMLKAMDDAVGEVLAKVRETGLEEDTLIFFLSDNGGYQLDGESYNLPLRGFKMDTYEGGVRVPFLVQWKGKIPAGKVYDKMISSLDIAATAVIAAGGKPAKVVEGVDLIPHLLGKKTEAPHDRLFWRWTGRWGARVGDWKLVQNGTGKDWRFSVTDIGKEQLFNLADDIGETKDLAATHPQKLKELQDAYKEWDAKNMKPRWLDGRRPKEDK